MGPVTDIFSSPKPKKTQIIQAPRKDTVDPNLGGATSAAKKRARAAAAKKGRAQLRVDLAGTSGEGAQTRTGLSIS